MKKNKKICIIGHFGFGKEYFDGQTIKTKIVTEELKHKYGNKNVTMIDTENGKKKVVTLPFLLLKSLKEHDNVIILPAHNGVRVIAPLLAVENRIFKRKIHYVVIGGWLPELVLQKKYLKKYLKTYNGIFVETKTMQASLVKQGFDNIFIMPNFKNLSIRRGSELAYDISEPLKLCTFSRVSKEKGIEDAVKAVSIVNQKMGREVFTLDIYGQVDSRQYDWFETLMKTACKCVKYKGVASFEKSVDVLKDYYALVFPTRFYTEGIPGTIIDAYAAGIPVIASRWESFEDVIDEEETGLGYRFTDIDNLVELLLSIALSPNRLNPLKQNCLNKAMNFTPERAMQTLMEAL